MPSRKWRPLVFVLAFTCVVPHHCVAGPMPRRLCRVEPPLVPPPNPFSNLFPRSVAFPQLPTTMLPLGGVNLTHITAPPEFRAHESKTANATGVILRTSPWPPPCRPIDIRPPTLSAAVQTSSNCLHRGIQ